MQETRACFIGWPYKVRFGPRRRVERCAAWSGTAVPVFTPTQKSFNCRVMLTGGGLQ